MHALVRGALARVTGEGAGRNAYKWRVWGVEQGYGDLARPEPGESPRAVYAPPAPVRPEEPTSMPWTYVAVPLILAALTAGLLYARGASKRQLAAIGTRTVNRREPRRAVRTAAQLPIRYRYMGHKEDFEPSKRYKGTTTDVSAEGVKLVVTLPDRRPEGRARLPEHRTRPARRQEARPGARGRRLGQTPGRRRQRREGQMPAGAAVQGDHPAGQGPRARLRVHQDRMRRSACSVDHGRVGRAYGAPRQLLVRPHPSRHVSSRASVASPPAAKRPTPRLSSRVG